MGLLKQLPSYDIHPDAVMRGGAIGILLVEKYLHSSRL